MLRLIVGCTKFSADSSMNMRYHNSTPFKELFGTESYWAVENNQKFPNFLLNLKVHNRLNKSPPLDYVYNPHNSFNNFTVYLYLSINFNSNFIFLSGLFSPNFPTNILILTGSGDCLVHLDYSVSGLVPHAVFRNNTTGYPSGLVSPTQLVA
jgi:hypothetical protein